MPSTKRIRLGLALLFTILAVLAGYLVAVVTVGANPEFVPGTGPAPMVGSGLRLPLSDRVVWPSGLGLVGNTGAWTIGGER